MPHTLLMSLLLLLGCADERVYVGDGVELVALTDDTAPAVETEDGAIYVVERRVDLPVRRAPDSVLQDLAEAAQSYEGLPFPRLPWVERGDLESQIDFVLSNLDDERHDVAVTVNGYNEFHEYVPGFAEIDEEPTPDFAQWERTYRIEPLERITGTVREDELDEVAVDLATVVNGAPSSNQVVFFENQSSRDERNRPYIPEVIPGLVGVRAGLRALEQANLLLELSIRVRNANDRLADQDDQLLEPMPEPFMPVTTEEE